jgi:hypothetical protein
MKRNITNARENIREQPRETGATFIIRRGFGLAFYYL